MKANNVRILVGLQQLRGCASISVSSSSFKFVFLVSISFPFSALPYAPVYLHVVKGVQTLFSMGRRVCTKKKSVLGWDYWGQGNFNPLTTKNECTCVFTLMIKHWPHVTNKWNVKNQKLTQGKAQEQVNLCALLWTAGNLANSPSALQTPNVSVIKRTCRYVTCVPRCPTPYVGLNLGMRMEEWYQML